jgi:glycosyltransferase involved in cell wall biosynthesis
MAELPGPEPLVAVIIPALNEAGKIGRVLDKLPRDGRFEAIVVDDGSTDGTGDEARARRRGRGPPRGPGWRGGRYPRRVEGGPGPLSQMRGVNSQIDRRQIAFEVGSVTGSQSRDPSPLR